MLDFFHRNQRSIKNDTLSGLTVALALVPEAVAFAFVAGVSPVVGLYSAIIICLVTAVVGGRPGMISAATGAMAVVIVTLVARHGLAYLFPAVILCGLIQVGVGFARLGMFIRMVPHSVMLGFVNGLAIVIFTAQFGSFKTINGSGQLAFLRGPSLWAMLALAALTMAIIWLLPKLTRAVPASLAAILLVTGLAVIINRSARPELAGENQRNVVMTVGDMLLTNAKAKAVADATGARLEPRQGSAVVGVDPRGGNAPTVVPTNALTSAGATVLAGAGATVPVSAEAAMASVDERSAGISGGLPRPFFLQYTLPRSRSPRSGSFCPTRSRWLLSG